MTNAKMKPIPLRADMTPAQIREAFDKVFEARHEAFLDFYASPRQLLNLKLRPVREEDLKYPSPPGTDRNELLAAVHGGLNSVGLNLLESSLLHVIVAAFSQADYPERIELTRSGLYELMGVEKSLTSGGRRQWLEGGAFWRTRNKYHNTLIGLGRKSWPFIFRQRGTDKKGRPTYSVAIAYEPLVKVKAIYKDVEEPELPGFVADDKSKDQRFSHYDIRLNPAAIGEVNHYFRYLPMSLPREIAAYRKDRGERARVAEFNFIEFLYSVSEEVIEINALKLAEKVKVELKGLKEPARKERRARQALRRCYETARALGFVLDVQEDQPAGRGETKEIIRLNPERFRNLSQGRLFGKTEA